MCSPAICDRCKKITWTGCGAHAQQVLASVPKDKRCKAHAPGSCADRAGR